MEIPKVIYIETTNKCNADCIMCPHKYMIRKLDTMNAEMFCEIIDSIKNIDLSETQLFLHKEGEPLCDENIFEKIAYAKSNLKDVNEIGINTNAMLLTKEKSKKLLEAGLDTIYFSVDGTSSSTYDKIRINCKYDTVEKNILDFFEIKNELKSNVRVIMQMLIYDGNKHEENEFREKWSRFGVEFYIKKMHCYLDGGMSSFDGKTSSKQKNVCDDPFRMIVVYVDGSTGCCCWDYNNEFNLGNVSDKSLLELYNSERINFMREKQRSKSCSDEIPCNRCMRILGDDLISKPEEK